MTAEQRRAQLLDATKAIVAERGFHAVSIEAVAREAGITRPIVYGHFGDLAGLLEALIEREAERASDQLDRVLLKSIEPGDPVEQMIASLRGYLEVVRSDPATWRLVLMPPEGAPEALHEHIARGRADAIGQLTAAVASVVPGGGESPDPELTARMLSVIADEAARLQLTDPERYPVERILTHARWALSRFGPA